MASSNNQTNRTTPVTFFDLPAELRNYIYDLSGCLQYYEHARYRRRSITPGDYTRNDHTALTGCCHGSKCYYASQGDFRSQPPAYIPINYDMTEDLYGTKRCQAMSSLTWTTVVRNPIKFHPPSQPNLTRVSRQVRSETLPIFMGNHPFVCTLFEGTGDQGRVMEWLEKIGEGPAGMMREVLVVYGKKRERRALECEVLPKMRSRGLKLEAVRLVRLEHPFDRCWRSVLLMVDRKRGLR